MGGGETHQFRFACAVKDICVDKTYNVWYYQYVNGLSQAQHDSQTCVEYIAQQDAGSIGLLLFDVVVRRVITTLSVYFVIVVICREADIEAHKVDWQSIWMRNLRCLQNAREILCFRSNRTHR